MQIRPLRIVALLAALNAFAAFAAGASEAVRCHYEHADASGILTVAPSAMPYMEPAHAVGGHFRLRAVLEAEAGELSGFPELAAFKVHLYSDGERGPRPLHQGEWAWPADETGKRHGFTGRQRIHDPASGETLGYWCEIAAGDAGSRAGEGGGEGGGKGTPARAAAKEAAVEIESRAEAKGEPEIAPRAYPEDSTAGDPAHADTADGGRKALAR